MVRDDPKDVELTLTALEEYNLVNEVVVVRDGQEGPGLSLLSGAIQRSSARQSRSRHASI